jgi:hypothetical protein
VYQLAAVMRVVTERAAQGAYGTWHQEAQVAYTEFMSRFGRRASDMLLVVPNTFRAVVSLTSIEFVLRSYVAYLTFFLGQL